MINEMPTRELEQRRVRARRTAMVLGLIALAIFTAFVGSAVLGR